jgi:hypothetical protein
MSTAEAAPVRGTVAIELELSRQRYLGWSVFGIVVGILLVLKLGTVGVWGGYLLIAIGVVRTAQLVQTFLRPPGTIVVSASEVVLPRGLHRDAPVTVAPSAVTAVYFLRRSVPWNRSSPVLVVELGDRAMAYPRDWFASEADQRHIVHALLRRRGDLLGDRTAETAAAAAVTATDAATEPTIDAPTEN